MGQRMTSMVDLTGEEGEENDGQDIDASFIPSPRRGNAASVRAPAAQRTVAPVASPQLSASIPIASSSIPSTIPRRPAYTDRESRRAELERMQEELDTADDLDLESNGIAAPLGASIVHNALKHASSLVEYVRARRGTMISADRNYKELIEWAHVLDAMWRDDYTEAFESAARRFAGVLEVERTGSWDFADGISRHAENVSLLPSTQLQRLVKAVSTNRTMTRGGSSSTAAPRQQRQQQQRFPRAPYQQQQQDASAPTSDGAPPASRSNNPPQNRRGGFNGGRGGAQRQ